jgi:hypothetical protein
MHYARSELSQHFINREIAQTVPVHYKNNSFNICLSGIMGIGYWYLVLCGNSSTISMELLFVRLRLYVEVFVK